MKLIIDNVSDNNSIKKVFKRVDRYCGMRQTSINIDINTDQVLTSIILDKHLGESCTISEDENTVQISIYS